MGLSRASRRKRRPGGCPTGWSPTCLLPGFPMRATAVKAPRWWWGATRYLRGLAGGPRMGCSGSLTLTTLINSLFPLKKKKSTLFFVFFSFSPRARVIFVCSTTYSENVATPLIFTRSSTSSPRGLFVLLYHDESVTKPESVWTSSCTPGTGCSIWSGLERVDAMLSPLRSWATWSWSDGEWKGKW